MAAFEAWLGAYSLILANFNGKEHLRHRAVSLRQHGFLFDLSLYIELAQRKARRKAKSKVKVAQSLARVKISGAGRREIPGAEICLLKSHLGGSTLTHTAQSSPDFSIFTARCTLVQSAVLRSQVICVSVCPSVTVNCDHIGWNSSKIISPLVSLGRSLVATLT